MVTAHNCAPGNAGIIFYLDILIPLLGFVLLWRQYSEGHRQLNQLQSDLG
jgi:hypothetical protein